MVKKRILRFAQNDKKAARLGGFCKDLDGSNPSFSTNKELKIDTVSLKRAAF